MTSSQEPPTCLEHSRNAQCFTGARPKKNVPIVLWGKAEIYQDPLKKSDPAWNHDDFSHSWLDLMRLVRSGSTAIVCFIIHNPMSLQFTPHEPPQTKSCGWVAKVLLVMRVVMRVFGCLSLTAFWEVSKTRIAGEAAVFGFVQKH